MAAVATTNPAVTAVAPVPEGKAYLLPLSDPSKGRSFINHGFSTQSLIRKRYTENTTTIAVTLNLLLPYLNAFNARLEGHIRDGEDLTAEDALRHLTECGLTALINYADVVARVSIQAGLACYLIEHPTAAGNATVYLWDAYPRMHRKYLGDAVAALRLPKLIASFFGVVPSATDLAIYDTRAPFGNIFEDSLRRHVLTHIADVIVTNFRLVVTSFNSRRAMAKEIKRQELDDVENAIAPADAAASALAKRKEAAAINAVLPQMVAVSTQKTIVFVGRAVGAAIGNRIDGGRGEYWGEMLSGIFVAGFSAVLLSKIVKKKTASFMPVPAGAAEEVEGAVSEIPASE